MSIECIFSVPWNFSSCTCQDTNNNPAMQSLPIELCSIIGKYASLCDRRNLRKQWPRAFSGLVRYEIDQVRTMIAHYFECDMNDLDALLVRERGRLTGALIGASLVHDTGACPWDDVAKMCWMRLFIHVPVVTDALTTGVRRIFSKIRLETDFELVHSVSDDANDNTKKKKKKLTVVLAETTSSDKIQDAFFSPCEMDPDLAINHHYDHRFDLPCVFYCPTEGVSLTIQTMRELDKRSISKPSRLRPDDAFIWERASAQCWRVLGFRVLNSPKPHNRLGGSCGCTHALNVKITIQCPCTALWCETCLDISQLRRSLDARFSDCRACSAFGLLTKHDLIRRQSPRRELFPIDVALIRAWMHVRELIREFGFSYSVDSEIGLSASMVIFTPLALQNGQHLRVIMDGGRIAGGQLHAFVYDMSNRMLVLSSDNSTFVQDCISCHHYSSDGILCERKRPWNRYMYEQQFASSEIAFSRSKPQADQTLCIFYLRYRTLGANNMPFPRVAKPCPRVILVDENVVRIAM